jgi:hypothetical protein
LARFVVQRPAQQGDVARQADVLDGGVRPDQLHKVGLFHDPPAPIKEHVQGVDCLGHQRNHFALPEQQTLFRVVMERPERDHRGIRHGEW